MIYFIFCRKLSALAGYWLQRLLYSLYTYHTQNRKREVKNGHVLNEHFTKGLADLRGVCVLHGLFLHVIMEKEVQSDISFSYLHFTFCI